MGFASGAIGFKRFFVDGDVPQRVDEEMIETLAKKAMGADHIRASDKTEIGWITGQHILDTKFDFAKNAVADGLCFAMRIDTNKPPADLVRGYQKQAEAALLEASGREFLSKAERREAREKALARADSEARSGVFRRMKSVPVFWDIAKGQLFLGSAASSVADQFMLLFRETFDLSTVPASSGEMAARWSGLAGEVRAYDDCKPCHLVTPPEGAEIEEVIPLRGSASKDFLGTEWLSWLMYVAHAESPEINTQLGRSVTVIFEKTLQLECAFKISGNIAVQADSPTRLPETPVALAGGKRPVRAGLQVAAGGELFGLTIRGDAMNFSAVQLQAPPDVSNPRELFEDRMDKLRTLVDSVGELYTAFLRRRLSTKWQGTLNAMRAWIASGQGAPAEVRAAS
jgi:hypothetical protein